MWDILQFSILLFVVRTVKVFPKTVVNVVGTVAIRASMIASVFRTQNSVTSGMIPLAMVVICPNLFRTISVDSIVSRTLARRPGIRKVVPTPFVTEPTRSTPLTLKEVSI